MPFPAASRRRVYRSPLRRAGSQESVRLRQLPQSRTHALGVVQPDNRRVLRRLRSSPFDGCLDGLENTVVADYETHAHDVLVVGAGGAGLRAAIEAAKSGARVGLVCKSLLGKAHTVMAEGGVAAALSNVDDRDNWRVHF